MSEQLVNQTSSIGTGWPPSPSTHNRLRGFYDASVLRDHNDVDAFAEEFEIYQAQTLAHPEIDRLSIRAVAHAGAIATLDSMGIKVEAAFPISHDEEDLMIAYTGWSAPNRAISAEYVASHQVVLTMAVRRGIDPKDRTRELVRQGLVPKILDARTPERLKMSMVPKFASMYAAFEYDEADVEELLTSEANTIAYVEDQENIISTAMAEEGVITVDGLEPITVVEITEASTHPAYRGRGLYKAISGYLIAKLLQENGGGERPINALYGESNLAMPGVVIAAYQNGRRFSHFDARNLGVDRADFGFLPQNFHVGDGVETRPYNDFALSYVPLN